MKLYDALTGKDKAKLCCMWLFTIGISGVFSLYIKNTITGFVVSSLISILYFIVFALNICNDYILEENELKLHQMIYRTFWGYIVGLTISSCLYLLPTPLHSLLAVSAFLCALLPGSYGIILTMYMTIILCLNIVSQPFEYTYLFFLCILGSLCAKYIQKKKYIFHISIIITALSISMYFISTYANGLDLTQNTVLYGCLDGILNVLLIVGFAPFLNIKEIDGQQIEYARTLEDDFPLMIFVRSLPEGRYEHCQLVSNLCFNLAKILGVDENLSCCAGFYYSLCNNDEADPIDYAVKLTTQNNLPIDVVRILSEYQGIKKPISSIETAIIDLVDQTILSFYKDDTKIPEGFERELLVHSVFNTLSQEGRYDESGMSMNAYLRIRDELIREVSRL